MSLVSGCPPHATMHHHHHDAHHYSLGEGTPPQYFTSWFISRADVPPSDYNFAPGFSPEYPGNNCPAGPDYNHHHHHHHYGPRALLPAGGRDPDPADQHQAGLHPQTHPRVVKRRPTANRKERRRTQSINSAFSELRECIPNVPADTKLSKIKTLRLATSYISYLMDVLDKDGQHEDTHAFKAELKKSEAREGRRKRDTVEILTTASSSSSSPLSSGSLGDRKTKGRTGWPEHVWALELKQ